MSGPCVLLAGHYSGIGHFPIFSRFALRCAQRRLTVSLGDLSGDCVQSRVTLDGLLSRCTIPALSPRATTDAGYQRVCDSHAAAAITIVPQPGNDATPGPDRLRG